MTRLGDGRAQAAVEWIEDKYGKSFNELCRIHERWPVLPKVKKHCCEDWS